MNRKILLFCACAWLLAGCGEDEAPGVVVTNFYPKKTAAASTVVIYGQYFSTSATGNVVKINGAEALVTLVGSTLAGSSVLHVKVPATATSGELSVTTHGKTATIGNIEIVSAEGCWQQKATFPGTWRQSPASFSHNGYGYIGLGYDEGQQFIDLWRYDPAANQWTQLNDATINPLYDPFTVVSTFVADGVAYMLCYAFEIGQMFMHSYDIEQDEWEWLGSDVPAMATFPSSINSNAYNGQGIFGCFTDSGDGGYSLPIYDIETKTWTISTLIPEQRGYVWFQDSKTFSVSGSALYEYTIATDTWQEKPFTNYPSPVNVQPLQVALNESVYFAMGSTNYMLLGDVWKYTPATDVWTPVTPCPSITGHPSFFTIDNKAYFVLGQPAYEPGSSVTKNLTTMMLTK
jgi:hypothetical protein